MSYRNHQHIDHRGYYKVLLAKEIISTIGIEEAMETIVSRMKQVFGKVVFLVRQRKKKNKLKISKEGEKCKDISQLSSLWNSKTYRTM